MYRGIAIIIFLLSVLFLPFWLWVILGMILIIRFGLFLEAPLITTIFELTNSSDGVGITILPISMFLFLFVGVVEIMKPRLADRRNRATL